MLDYIAYIAVRLLNKIFNFIPISGSLWLGRRMGSIAFFFNKKRRVIAYANLKAAFAMERTPRELGILTKKAYQNLVQTVMEILNLTKVDKGYAKRYVEIVNINRIHNASTSGRGTILLTGHFGDWELSSLVSAVIGYPILVLVREQKMARVNELLNKLRESKGCRVIRKGISMKNIIKALYEKNIVGILSDQDAGKNGVFVDFFGRPTSCHSGPMEMAKRTDSIILPNFIVRVKGPYHKVFLEEYIDFRDSKVGDDVKDGLQRFAKLLESYIRRYPDQWLWLHKRWKSTPVRTVLILDDGRKGHLNQSLRIAKEIQNSRVSQGYKIDDTKIVMVSVKFKNNFFRTILSACAAFAGWRCQGCMRCMKLCLDKDSYETLMKTYSEFVVSCGSSLAGVNVFMSKENNAKNIIVMRPGALSFKKFSLLIIPRHDRPLRADNVLETVLAPNLIDSESLERDGDRLSKEFFSIEKDEKFIGVLIGGDNPELSLTEELADKAVASLLKFCEQHDAKLLVTTSRRTAGGVETVLKERLGDNPYCRLLIIANEKNIDAAVGGILSLSKIVVVSGESISMVSEAVSSGKKTVVFRLEKRRMAKTKHELAIEDLAREGYLYVSTADGLAEAARNAWLEERHAKEVKDRENMSQAVRRLL